MPPVAVAPRTPPAVDLEALVRRHQVALWRYLRALGCEAALADDLLQDTFLVAFRRLSDAGDDVAVAAFLRRTGRHLFLRRRRDAGRREALLLELGDRLWQRDCAADGGERWLAALRACVARLEGRPREVVRRFYGDGLGRAEVAAAMGMKENGVKTLLQRVRVVLRRCVEEQV